MDQEQPGTAAGWYAEAVRLAPDVRQVYDEALGRIAQLMEDGLAQIDVAQSRAIAHHALRILQERTRRWPRTHAAVARDALLLEIARAEMLHGNVTEARQRLEQSLAARETRDGHQELGLLLERLGEPRDAAHHYRRALDMSNDGGAEGRANRAEIQERLGDTYRASGEEQQAQRMYRQALSIWDELVDDTNGARTSVVQVRRGVLLSRLGQQTQATEAFSAAIEAAPSWREPYATILSHLVVSGSPDIELAQTVLRRAQYQLTLEPEWKVYFALWVQTIAARASAQPEGEVTHVFSDLAHGDSWSARLAAFGRGELAYPALAQAAHSRGERAEAHFYEGARLLGAGDTTGARRHFEEVMQSGMVSFYEYAMAQELLASLPRPATGQAAAPTVAPPRR
jgi:tetratricopeptide (TPR) repeat protein